MSAIDANSARARLARLFLFTLAPALVLGLVYVWLVRRPAAADVATLRARIAESLARSFSDAQLAAQGAELDALRAANEAASKAAGSIPDAAPRRAGADFAALLATLDEHGLVLSGGHTGDSGGGAPASGPSASRPRTLDFVGTYLGVLEWLARVTRTDIGAEVRAIELLGPTESGELLWWRVVIA